MAVALSLHYTLEKRRVNCPDADFRKKMMETDRTISQLWDIL